MEIDQTCFLFIRYGCKNWQPATLPEGETKETQESKRIELKMLVTNKGDEARIAELHVITYFTQRLDINEGKRSAEFNAITRTYLYF